MSSWSFTGEGDLQDTKIVVKLGNQGVGSFSVDNSFAPVLTGNKTGTTVKVPVRVKRRK